MTRSHQFNVRAELSKMFGVYKLQRSSTMGILLQKEGTKIASRGLGTSNESPLGGKWDPAAGTLTSQLCQALCVYQARPRGRKWAQHGGGMWKES